MSKTSTPVVVAIIVLSLVLSACSLTTSKPTSTPSSMPVQETLMATPEETRTPIPPTPTAVPLAVLINGEAITLADFEAELDRFQAAQTITGTILAPETNMVVMNELIDQTLLAQGAAEFGYIVDETRIQTRLTSLEEQLGGAQALEVWISTHGYSELDFRQSLRRSIGAAWMRDQIINNVPETADQVHAVQILLSNSADAEEAYALLGGGTDFLELAATYDPATKGELGWFPRDFIGEPGIDEAVFALQSGQYSSVIETEIGYHIIYVVERDANHPLQPDARIAFQVEAIRQWLEERRSRSEIEILLP